MLSHHYDVERFWTFGCFALHGLSTSKVTLTPPIWPFDLSFYGNSFFFAFAFAFAFSGSVFNLLVYLLLLFFIRVWNLSF